MQGIEEKRNLPSRGELRGHLEGLFCSAAFGWPVEGLGALLHNKSHTLIEATLRITAYTSNIFLDK